MQRTTRAIGLPATSAVVMAAIVIAAVAISTPCRAGDPVRGSRDDVQVQHLFDAVRVVIPKLKAGTKWQDARRLLEIDKFEPRLFIGSVLESTAIYEFPGNKEQKLIIQKINDGSAYVVKFVRLLDHGRIVVEFDADKK